MLVSKHVSTRCECGMLSVSSSCLGPKCAVCVRVCVCVSVCKHANALNGDVSSIRCMSGMRVSWRKLHVRCVFPLWSPGNGKKP